METNATTARERNGISAGLAVVLVLAALLVGAASGLAVGAAGGFLVGSRQASSGTGSEAGGMARAALTESPSGAAARGRGSQEDGELPDGANAGAGPSDAVPAEPGLPGVPGIVLDGVERPFLGVEVATSAASSGEGAAPDEGPGALVNSVQADTAAEQAGLQAGDRILALDGQEIASGEDLAAAIARTEVGDEIVLTVLRGDEELTMTATIGARPGITSITPGMPDLEELFDQMPPELRDRYRRLLEPAPDDTDA